MSNNIFQPAIDIINGAAKKIDEQRREIARLQQENARLKRQLHQQTTKHLDRIYQLKNN